MTKSRGRIPNVQAVISFKPGIMKTLMAHVSSVMFGESGLSRAQLEIVASEVSATNKCQY
jgi:alkylhydroperoxidase family enzyme